MASAHGNEGSAALHLGADDGNPIPVSLVEEILG